MGNKHSHIAINKGHLTWVGKNPPTAKQIEAFEKLADVAIELADKYCCFCKKSFNKCTCLKD